MWQAKSTFTSPQLNEVIKHVGYDACAGRIHHSSKSNTLTSVPQSMKHSSLKLTESVY